MDEERNALLTIFGVCVNVKYLGQCHSSDIITKNANEANQLLYAHNFPIRTTYTLYVLLIMCLQTNDAQLQS